LAAALVVALLGAAPGAAQTIDIGASIGWYAPIGAMVKRGSIADPSTFLEKRPEGALSLGADVVVWTSDHLGFCARVGYAPSTVAVSDSTGTHDATSSVVLASARVLYAFSPLRIKKHMEEYEMPFSFYVGAGPAIAARSGAVWSYSSGLTSPALAVSAGFRTPLATRIIMRFDASDNISRVHFDKGLPTETEPRTHHDLTFYFSFAYRLVQ
jgi:hypothetical protein